MSARQAALIESALSHVIDGDGDVWLEIEPDRFLDFGPHGLAVYVGYTLDEIIADFGLAP